MNIDELREATIADIQDILWTALGNNQISHTDFSYRQENLAEGSFTLGVLQRTKHDLIREFH